MTRAELVLEFLRVLLSWPPLVALILFYFLRVHKDGLGLVINRFAEFVHWKLTFPGGAIEAGNYPPVASQEKPHRDASEGIKEGTKLAKESPAKAQNDLEGEFTYFLRLGIETNLKIIETVVDKRWNKLMRGAFALMAPKSSPSTVEEKIQAMGNFYDQRVLVDLSAIRNVLAQQTPAPRSELITTYVKSQKLVWYLSQ